MNTPGGPQIILIIWKNSYVFPNKAVGFGEYVYVELSDTCTILDLLNRIKEKLKLIDNSTLGFVHGGKYYSSRQDCAKLTIRECQFYNETSIGVYI